MLLADHRGDGFRQTVILRVLAPTRHSFQHLVNGIVHVAHGLLVSEPSQILTADRPRLTHHPRRAKTQTTSSSTVPSFPGSTRRSLAFGHLHRLDRRHRSRLAEQSAQFPVHSERDGDADQPLE